MGSLDNQTTKQVFGSGYKLPKLHWKGEKSRECEPRPSVSSQEANTIHGGKKREKEKRKKIKNKQEKRKKKYALPAVSMVFSPAGSWILAR